MGQLMENILHSCRKLEWWDCMVVLVPETYCLVEGGESMSLETRGKAPGDTGGIKTGEGREACREGRRRPESQGAREKGSFLETRRSVSRGAGGHSVRCQGKAQRRGDREEELG